MARCSPELEPDELVDDFDTDSTEPEMEADESEKEQAESQAAMRLSVMIRNMARSVIGMVFRTVAVELVAGLYL